PGASAGANAVLCALAAAVRYTTTGRCSLVTILLILATERPFRPETPNGTRSSWSSDGIADADVPATRAAAKRAAAGTRIVRWAETVAASDGYDRTFSMSWAGVTPAMVWSP